MPYGRSCSGVAKGGWHTWLEWDFSPYLGEMENAGSLAARNDLKGLRRVVVTCPETELSPGITVPLVLQNPSLYFWRKW